MDYTDRSFRYLYRLLSQRATLYTEMIAANALVDDRGDRRKSETLRTLEHDDLEGLTVAQLGGATPKQLEGASEIVRAYGGFAGVNLNVGCPSDRVAGSGCFGAAMMRDAELVAECCRAMSRGFRGPVSVKCRIGVVDKVDELRFISDDAAYEKLAAFVATVADNSDVTTFIVHARHAVLSGLSPDKNRVVPQFMPHLVDRLAIDFPDLNVVHNGCVTSYDDAIESERRHLRGTMVGRDVWKRPWYWASVDTALFGADKNPASNRRSVLTEYGRFGDNLEELLKQKGRPRNRLIKPIMNLFAGDPGTARFKRLLEERRTSHRRIPFSDYLLDVAEETLDPDVLDRQPDLPPLLLGGPNDDEDTQYQRPIASVIA